MSYFDEEGNLLGEIEFTKNSHGERVVTSEKEATKLVLEGRVKADSDAARIYYLRKYYNSTEGNNNLKTMYIRAGF